MEPDLDEKNRTLFCGNLEDRVTEDILFELFLQAGPLEKVKIPLEHSTGKKKSFAFITFKHDVSVPYTLNLMKGTSLYGRQLKLQSRQGSVHDQQNTAAGFGRSMSAPHMGQQNLYMQMMAQVTGGGYNGGSPHNHQDSSGERSRNHDRESENYHRSRPRYDRNDSGSRHQREDDNRRNRNSNFDRDRKNKDYDQRHRNDRGKSDSRDKNYDRDRSQDRNYTHSSSYNTPPNTNRVNNQFNFMQQQNSQNINIQGFPLMNAIPAQNIDQLRHNIMANQQRMLQFNQEMQFQQQQQRSFYSRGSRQYQGKR